MVLTTAHHCRDTSRARPILSWPILQALRTSRDALREAVAAHRRYEWLRSRGVPHDTALRQALGTDHSACECSAVRVVLTHKETRHAFRDLEPAKSWRNTIALWIARCRQRGALEELNDRLLEDIGVSKDEALREAAKPFWR